MVKWVSYNKIMDYFDSYSVMERKVEQLILGNSLETIFLLEMKDVYTTGSMFVKSDCNTNNLNDIPIIHSNRGGRITYHGPGQRVIYPILNLSLGNRNKDLQLYIKMLELWIINTLYSIGVKGFSIAKKPGVWVKTLNQEDRKIASIGIRVRKWVTYHGIAINIFTDLKKFDCIKPCGDSFKITSLKQLGYNISMCQFDILLKTEFNKVF